MAGQSGLAELEDLNKLAHCEFAMRQQSQNAQTRRLTNTSQGFNQLIQQDLQNHINISLYDLSQ